MVAWYANLTAMAVSSGQAAIVVMEKVGIDEQAEG
jgi:hypothetical protein